MGFKRSVWLERMKKIQNTDKMMQPSYRVVVLHKKRGAECVVCVYAGHTCAYTGFKTLS